MTTQYNYKKNELMLRLNKQKHCILIWNTDFGWVFLDLLGSLNIFLITFFVRGLVICVANLNTINIYFLTICFTLPLGLVIIVDNELGDPDQVWNQFLEVRLAFQKRSERIKTSRVFEERHTQLGYAWSQIGLHFTFLIHLELFESLCGLVGGVTQL